ncbi:taurine catabolism dioxygenase [Meredithblackwellia eburnea MCA 4105]
MSTQTKTTTTSEVGSLTVRASYEPLKPTGALAHYEQYDSNPVIGREFRNVQLADILDAPEEEGDKLLRELAIIVSQRNVVFFRDQQATLSEQHLKKLANKLGILSGRPKASKLHIHPTEHQPDLELSPITTSFTKRKPGQSLFASRGWHSDITFEPVPSDFAMLQIHTLPESGGDTLWGSAYEAYDRLTPALAKFLEGLTALHDGNGFHNRAKVLGIDLHEGPRGHPLNVGANLQSVHPVIRTNAVTGWKGLFVNPGFTKRIVELNLDESDALLKYLFRIITDNHDLQVRFTWKKNDVAIWSNAASYHTVTTDYEGLEARKGNRTVSLGEKPYFDPASKGRRETLGLPAWSE